MKDPMLTNTPGRLYDPAPFIETPRRIFPTQPLGGAMRSRAASIILSQGDITQEQFSLSNGDETFLDAYIRSESDEPIIATIQSSLYSTTATAAHELPGGSSMAEANFQIIGPFQSLIKSDGTECDQSEALFRLYVRNISNGATFLVWHYRINYIINKGGASSST